MEIIYEPQSNVEVKNKLNIFKDSFTPRYYKSIFTSTAPAEFEKSIEIIWLFQDDIHFLPNPLCLQGQFSVKKPVRSNFD